MTVRQRIRERLAMLNPIVQVINGYAWIALWEIQ